MRDDEVDARLGKAGGNWRSALVAASDATETRVPLQSGPRSSRWPVIVAGLAVVLIVVASVGLIVYRSNHQARDNAAGSQIAFPPNSYYPPPGISSFYTAVGTAKAYVPSPAAAYGPGDTVVIRLNGSGSCPPIAVNPRVSGSQVLSVDVKARVFVPTPSPPSPVYLCTADSRPHYTTLTLPHRIDQAQPLTIKVIDESTTETIDMPGRP